MQSRVMKPAGAETAPVGDDSITRAVAAVPFAGSKPAVVAVPQLAIVTYASFCAEMAVWPEHAEKIRQTYGVVSPVVHEALDAYWRERAARNPEVHRELWGRYEQYERYLRELRAHGQKRWGP
jgi:hypothetical protein